MTPPPQAHRDRRIFLALFFFTGLLIANGARAAAFVLSPHLPVETPAHYAFTMEDATGEIKAGAVLDGSQDAKFHPQPAGRTSLGVTSSTWWLRFEAKNPTDAPVAWVFTLPSSMVDLVDIYVMEGGREKGRFELGDKRPVGASPLSGEGYSVPVTTGPGQTTTIYVRLQNLLGDGLDMYFEVSSPEAFAAHQLKVWIFFGVILGGGLVLFLYNAVIYLVVRDSLYIWYLLYLFFVLLTFVAASGLGQHFIWSHEGRTSEAMPPFASSLALIFVVQFSRKFLETKRTWPGIDRLLKGFMAYLALPPIVFLAGYGGLAAKLVMSASIILMALPFLGAWAWLSGQKTALIFTLGWGVWFASLCSLSGRILGLLPTNDFTLRIGWIGILGEAILFALALAVRIRLLRLEKAAAEEREHAALRRTKEELEILVGQRTQELQRLNREKDRLFSIVAHDLRNPFTGVVGMADMLSAQIHQMTPAEIDSCLRDLRHSADTFHKLLENLLSWALLQLGGVKFRPEAVDFSSLAKQCINLFAQAAQEKELRIETEGIANLRLEADPQMLETIVRNLLSNAIKYSRPGGRVALSARRDTGTVEIAVSDEGVGLDEERAARLFDFAERTSSPGTQGEKGTGLGLQLCRELVEIHGGKLTVVSRPDAGTTFRFSLPQPPKPA